MLYLKSFSLLSREQEEQFFFSGDLKTRRTCYTSKYPFWVFRYRELVPLEFEPVTILHGGNGSGKTTMLNVIAEKLHVKRGSAYNRSDFFESYVRLCKSCTVRGQSIPQESRIICSDDVFDYLLDVRCINSGIDTERARMLGQYVNDRREPNRLRSLDGYEEWRRRDDAQNKSESRFLSERLMRNVSGRSNGESALMFFTDSIRENALYLLDEPENSLSAEKQLELKQFIEDSARFYNCQFIISTHSPFLLSIDGAKIYDLDEVPLCTKQWTQLENVRTYHDFFLSHSHEFEEMPPV